MSDFDDKVDTLFRDSPGDDLFRDSTASSISYSTAQVVSLESLQAVADEFDAWKAKHIADMVAKGGRRTHWPDMSIASLYSFGNEEPKENATLLFVKGVGMVVMFDAMGKDPLFLTSDPSQPSVTEQEFLELCRNHQPKEPTQ